MNKSAGYKEILEVLDKHQELINGDYSVDIRIRIESRIKLEEISKEFDIEIDDKDSNTGWIRLSEYEFIGMFGEAHNRKISWSDDGAQPENERLLRICFPTGPYALSPGRDCPSNTFSEFFNELKNYSPKYIDSANKGLYFSADKAGLIHKDFQDIFKKYRGMAGKELKAIRIKELKDSLANLEES